MAKAKARRKKHERSSSRSHTGTQRTALLELRRLAQAHPDKLLAVDGARTSSGALAVRVRISTAGIEQAPGGLPITEPDEQVYIILDDSYPNAPPHIQVDHHRFVGFAHVLKGFELCIYLDPSREWHPSFGMRNVIERLREWFKDAAENRLDSRRALFHVFGGVNPVTMPAPTVVVRSSPVADGKRLSLATLRPRGAHRLDVVGWRTGRAGAPDVNLLLMQLDAILPCGVETSFLPLMRQIVDAGGPPPSMVMDALERAASSSVPGTPLYLGIGIPHPAEPTVLHLAAGQLDASSTDLLRTQQGPKVFESITIGWLPMSDERPEIATRRDQTRPARAFLDRNVELWGCGGLGSWIAEFVTRAGASRIVLRDSGRVEAGLLVRQNYTEEDLGKPKATQLAERLHAISDRIEVVAEPGTALKALEGGTLPACDVLIDATVNETIAARLDEVAQPGHGSLLAQVATDPRTATLGLLLVAAPAAGTGPASVDREVAQRVLGDPHLERFHGFWASVSKSDQLVPELGCSVPTFHGSAADVAVIAGCMVNLIGQHFSTDASGTHLVAVPAAGGSGPTHHFIPHLPSG